MRHADPRTTVTDVLEIAGLLLLVAAVAVLAWHLNPAAGLASGGAGLIAAAALLTWLSPKPKPTPDDFE